VEEDDKLIRRKDLDKIASLVGNSAAHAAIYPDETARKEITVYYDDAHTLASARSWNQQEIDYFRKKAKKRAENEIKKRGFEKTSFTEKAHTYIEDFIHDNMHT